MRKVATPIEILMVEDDAGDIAYTREMFAEHRLRNTMTVLSDGLQAIGYLRREPPYQDAKRPDLILLDLNLPMVDGRTVLEFIRNEPALREIVVVVLTTSEVEEQVLRGFGVPADRYVRKPVDFDRLVEVVRTVQDFYVQVETY
ncbi:two-component system response regulator [Virgisporangium aliadipatigenens]|uniref:Two-component system response regulator n=1 Tax=Virgisporangium aliadipatigenens TaxID=741659 RepID=A0A8J3YFY6_9ACTN|nr:two-component system response regulator [Virgisporangium aliadipatigenens]